MECIVSFRKPSTGTRGRRTPRFAAAVSRLTRQLMIRKHRRDGDRFMGTDILYLTTIGAKTGQQRETPLSYFRDGDGAWLVLASAAGAANNPAWYHNVAAHPDQVWVATGGQHVRVTAEQLEGDRRAAAWQRILDASPRFASYQEKTDRVLPILRLVPVP
jgi:deazaflavin-dependent oxidoreductase (nitroreductase family)